ncbi:class I SAM-dependent methyltransferase [Hoeflea sp.]|uniref:class I SAM-dependent methyltransferase n=1 Tax=Hoeflea sp. TaxID=1940281 RepID=UPI00198B9104|nr:class I SAM-dependent methyltransferase [Hoeflea sp.]MBC7285643.1 class I SAM-dependent methyltransferase [Hoeflea sp.]
MKAQDLYVGEKGAHYFEQRAQNRSSETQRRRARYFEGFTKHDQVVLDFGCGTGGVLACLDAERRLGVEVSEYAAREAREVLDAVFGDLSAVGDGTVDRIVSYHALEHVDSPSRILAEFHRVLKPGGAVRIFVPCEMPLLLRSHRGWEANDDMHLHSWTPLTLGNLLSVSGFEVERAEILPGSGGGRLGAMFGEGSKGKTLFSYLKSLRSGQFHTVVMARKKAGS